VKAWIAPGSISFYVGGPSSSARSGGAMFGMGVWFPSRLLLEGNSHI
jgi:hypothetical protein